MSRWSRIGGRVGFRPATLAGCIVCSLLLPAPFEAAAGPLTNVHTVFIIVLENKDWSGIRGNPDCPYINDTLLPLASQADQYFTPNDLHPSEPNYLWLEAGTNFGVFNDDNPDKNHFASTNHLVNLLENAGIDWKTYQESYQPPDSPLTDHYPYAARHDPFVFFDDVAQNPARLAAHVRPYSELATDLRDRAVAPYNFIVPNVTNDMHSLAKGSQSKEKQGDEWLRREVPGILASDAYTNNGALFIVWDEGHKAGPIGLILLSPLAKGGGYRGQVPYTHSSLLRTIQEVFAVQPFLGDAANATDLGDLFQFQWLATAPQPGLSLSRNPIDGTVSLDVGGVAAGDTVLLQTSNDLLDWFTVSTNLANAATFHLTVQAPSNGLQNFYRTVELR
jgi:hypothetical protein